MLGVGVALLVAGFGPELFDLETDPDEAINRADDLTCGTIVTELRSELRRIVIPEAADQCAKSDQQELVERFDGRKAAFRIGTEGALHRFRLYDFVPHCDVDVVSDRFGAKLGLMHR